ncbi:putative methyltransferase C70.08c [Podospora conica]|nr:putative methyltransferase C70.08c [Schizothecium conicum]
MAPEKEDNWSSEAYQHSASFVPKLATKIMQWLDPQPDDVILDIGCGDGVLDLQIGHVLSRGTGSLHGIDSSPAMIAAAEKAAAAAGLGSKCTFDVLDATTLPQAPTATSPTYTKLFSNAALHWILRPPASRVPFFRAAHAALAPGGLFAFEMGGLGNVCEVRAAVLAVLARRVGMARAKEAEPWFFPDEAWVRETMEGTAGGWVVERVEREWRPTDADGGGVEGWVGLMVGGWVRGVVGEEEERGECLREVVEVLEEVCGKPGPKGGWMFSYVRLRVLARRV